MTQLLAKRPRVDRAFERLYRRHVADVYHYALGVLRSTSDAEDVTQTTFLNAYAAYQRGDRPDAPRRWLIAIAHNVCLQRFRASARRPQEVALDEDVGAALVEEHDGPTAEDIRRALGQLTFNQRAALVMRELEGRSYAEIGEILGVSLSAVETLIFRARRALREQLEGSLTCSEAELALSRQLDGRLPRAERGPLRAHLRACPECASFARSQRAQRAALRSIAAVPLPSSLASFFGGGGSVAGAGLAAKTATVVAAGVLIGGVGYEGAKQVSAQSADSSAVAGRPSAEAGPAGGADGDRLAAMVRVAPSQRASAGAPAARPRGKQRARAVAKGRPEHAGTHGHRPGKEHSKAARRPAVRLSAGHSGARGRSAPPGNANGHDKPQGKLRE